MPIARKIMIAMFLVSLFLLSIVIIVSSHLSSTVIIDQAKKATSQSLHDVSEKLDMTFKEIETYSKMAIADAALQDELTESYEGGISQPYYDKNNAIVRLLRTFIKPRTKIESMSILDFYSGSVYSANEVSSFNELSAEAIASIKQQLNPRNLVVWGDARLQSNVWVVPIFMKIYNGYSGGPLGLLETDIPLSLFSEILTQGSLRDNEFLIIDEKGHILADHNGAGVFATLTSEQLDFCIDSIDVPTIHNGSLYETKTYDISKWFLTSVVSLDEISAATRPLMLQFIILGVLSLVITLIISYLLSSSITKPLRAMEQSMGTLDNLVVPRHVPVHGEDEVGRLARVYNDMIDKIATAIEENNAEQKQIRQYEISLLQAQINPHFLNNIMENISGLVELDRQEESLSLIRDAAAFYRSVLSGGELMVSIERELEIARLYLKIQNVRHDNRIYFTIQADDDVLLSPIVKLTIQPLLENAITHGLVESEKEWEISIEAHAEDADVVINVCDNGVGMDPQTVLMLLEKDKWDPRQAKKRSVGVYATHQRLVLAFGDLYGLRYQSEVGKGTCVTIRLPKEIRNELQ